MVFPYRRQPLKALYIAYSLVFLLCRLPIWTVTCLIPACRPRRTWTAARTFRIRLLRYLVDLVFAVDLTDRPPPDPATQALSAESNGFVWVDAIPDEMLRGELESAAQVNEVRPARVSGYWYGDMNFRERAGRPARPGEKVVYHLHAGGYVTGTAAPAKTGEGSPIITGLVRALSGQVDRLFSLEYRLSSGPPRERRNPFPAAILDALAGYRYLVHDRGFAPSDIVLVGDSSGGGLAIALLRYLIAQQASAVPGSLVLLSPSVDWGYTHDSASARSSVRRNWHSDYSWLIFNEGFTRTALLGRLPSSAAEEVWISPASTTIQSLRGLFAGFPRTLIVVGGAEHTVDAMETFRDRLRKDIGPDSVQYLAYPDAVHNFCAFPWHEPERSECFTAIRAWILTGSAQ